MQIATGVEELGNGRFLVNDETAYDTACVIWLNRVYGEEEGAPDRIAEPRRPDRYPCEVLCAHEEDEDGSVAIFTVVNV